MTNITIDHKELEACLGTKLSVERLKQLIPMMGTDLGGTIQGKYEVEIFPNRPDLLSFQGFSRALGAFMGISPGLKQYKAKQAGYKVIIDKSVAKVRPYTACAIVKGIRFDEARLLEVIQLQEKLHLSFGRNRKRVAIGIYPLEKLRLPIRYLAKRPDEICFVPLDAKREMTGSQILSLHPKGKEYAHLLEGAALYPVFVDANDNILSMPPIINSELTGKLTEATHEAFIECSGHDFRVLSQALNLIVTALADMGGTIYSMELQYPDRKLVTPELSTGKLRVQQGYIEGLIGCRLKNPGQLLGRMGLRLKSQANGKLDVEIPCYRTDILHPVEIVEDLAIAYGYDNIKAELPDIANPGAESRFEEFRRTVARLLSGHGLLETNTYCIIRPETEEKLQSGLKLIPLKDSRTEYCQLRASVLSSLMQVLSDNLHNEYPQNLFEIGDCFLIAPKLEHRVTDIRKLAVVLAPGNYTNARQILDSLFQHLQLKACYQRAEHPSFIEGRNAMVSINGKMLAHIGEIHPQVLSNFGLELPVAAFELNLTKLFSILDLD
jgi:phenylalanyl-tRNA synthetase beta chain